MTHFHSTFMLHTYNKQSTENWTENWNVLLAANMQYFSKLEIE